MKTGKEWLEDARALQREGVPAREIPDRLARLAGPGVEGVTLRTTDGDYVLKLPQSQDVLRFDGQHWTLETGFG